VGIAISFEGYAHEQPRRGRDRYGLLAARSLDSLCRRGMPSGHRFADLLPAIIEAVMSPRAANAMFGIVPAVLGGIFGGVGVVGAITAVQEGSIWGCFVGCVMLILGAPFFAIGMGFLLVPVVLRLRRQYILRRGISVTARVTEVRRDRDSWMNVNNQYPWVIKAQWQDPLANEVRQFVSRGLWVNPQDAYPVDSEVTVAYLAGKPTAYAFRLDRLPKADKPTPTKWKRLETDVPLPDDIEVEELPDGVRYLLPGNAVIMLDYRRLRGWSGKWGIGKCSRPTHRVRRLMVWRMGIWVECDGWYRRTALFFSHDNTNPPPPRLLVSVAQDLAKRMDRAGRTGPLVLVHDYVSARLSGAQVAEDEFEAFTGEVDGEIYHVDSLAWGSVAVWIDIPSEEMSLPDIFVINPNSSREPVDDPARKAEIAALFEMGARDVDVGFHSDLVSANFPMDIVIVDREFAERVVRYLVALKRKSLAKSQGGEENDL